MLAFGHKVTVHGRNFDGEIGFNLDLAAQARGFLQKRRVVEHVFFAVGGFGQR